ncbi:uncharacterized protein LOC130645549 [Hydractinia symbiolongicarpus]|uniref:uncharacterized protein LOC130645549 n=1 Tax=Hydractinia symbiolongicarpus TaxID=13093 RepID=UPI002550C1BA|nr:uncharacterized protein LOC130645549 [Hydractinia symbiolongicarpus]
MSCPSCQVAGRRLPSLPLAYVSKTKINVGVQNLKRFSLSNGRLSIKQIDVGELNPRCTSADSLEENDLQGYLLENPYLVEEFVMKNVSQEQIERWLIRKCKITGKENANSDEEHNRPSLSKWKFCVHKDKRKLLDSLTEEIHKEKTKNSILLELSKNICQAVHASRFSLYLLDDSGKVRTSFFYT